MDNVTEIPKSETQLAEERVKAVERQINRHLPPGCRASILCPYCGTWNFNDGKGFCCDLLRRAVLAVMMGKRAMKMQEAAERANNN